MLAADPVDPARIVVLERWRSQADVDAFRGSGTPSDLGDRIRGADVAEADVAGARRLT